MSHPHSCRPLLLGVVLLFTIAVSAPPAHAKWTDNSGNLPGLTSLRSVLILGAIAGGGTVALLRVLGRGKDLRAVPSRLDLAGTSSDGTVTLVNAGKRPLSIISLDLPADNTFSLGSPGIVLPTTLQPDQSLAVAVRFAPQAAGTFSNELSITTRDANSKTRQFRVKVRGAARADEVLSVATR